MNDFPDEQPDVDALAGEPETLPRQTNQPESHLTPDDGGRDVHDLARSAAVVVSDNTEADTRDPLDHPGFELVRLAVSQLRSRERRTTAAAVKTEMQRLSAGGFNELDQGFESFRQFLVAAESAGAILVRLPSYGSGHDAYVGLPEEAESIPSRESSPRRIRSDIWSSFFDFRPNMVHVFDRREHRAVIFPTDPVPMEPSSTTELRARYQSSPGEFYKIEPISFDEQLGWMNEFTATAAEEHRSLLGEALKMERPLAAFTAAVRANSALASQWNSFRIQHVTGKVKQWMELHGLEFDLYDPNILPVRPAKRTRETVNKPEERSSTGRDGEELRKRILQALAKMPLSELLQLRIPVEYMLGQ
ncbi:hypothetical protein [Amycolatopsis sp. MEPSY49]|uniref:hypothetical protein n=1 Tax=Amycolatopsis sp. MEPSY49 TaxID=3151600 RepID=UPI003EF4A4B6